MSQRLVKEVKDSIAKDYIAVYATFNFNDIYSSKYKLTALKRKKFAWSHALY